MSWRDTVRAAASPRNPREYREAWQAIYDACNASVRLLARMMVGPRRGYDVNDIEQEVFLKASQGIGGLELEEGRELAGLKSWMHRITRNHVIDRIRASRARHQVDAPRGAASLDDIEVSSDHESMHVESIERTLSDPDAMIYLRQLLDALPDEDRLLLFHSCIDKLEFEELAEVIQAECGTACTAPGLRKRLQRLLPSLVAFAELGRAAIRRSSAASRGHGVDYESS
ncbi:MAG: sigma-70 family polymerase sigma factor [Myxococcaceae bacterium]|nr:sigma-70 family polymerase sigma factor [Myxococcaceae bacterium]